MMCNLKKRLIHAAFWVPLQVMFMNEWKQMAQWLKSQERLPTIKKKLILVKHFQRQQFSFMKKVLKCLLKSWVFKLKA